MKLPPVWMDCTRQHKTPVVSAAHNIVGRWPFGCRKRILAGHPWLVCFFFLAIQLMVNSTCTLMTAAELHGMIIRNDEKKLLDFLHQDVLALIHVSNPRGLASAMAELEFSDTQWEELSALICANEVGLMTNDELKKLTLALADIESAIANLDSLTLVVHQLNVNRIDFSLAIDASDEKCDRLWNALQQVGEVATNVRINGGTFVSPLQHIASWNRTKIDRFHIFRNWNKEGLNWIAIDQQRSLTSSRAFQRVWKQLSRARSDAFAYYAPRNSKDLMSLLSLVKSSNPFEKDEEKQPVMSLDEVVGAGASTDFSTEDADSLSKVRSFVCFTIPRSGVSLDWEAYVPIEVYPQIPLPVYEFKARHCDKLKARFASKKKWEKQGHPPEQFFHTLKTEFAEIGIDPKDADTAFAEEYSARFLVELSGELPPIESQLFIERVREFEAARSYVQGIADYAIKTLPSGRSSEKIESPTGALLYRDSPKLTVQKLNNSYFAPNQYRRLSKSEIEHLAEFCCEARSLDSDWHLLGFLGCQKLIRHEEESKYKDFVAVLKQRIAELQSPNPPFAVEAYSPKSWDGTIHELFYNLGIDLDETPTEPDNREETIALLSASLIASLADKFGSQLWVYSQDDSQMEVDIQIYRSPKFLFPDAYEILGENRRQTAR